MLFINVVATNHLAMVKATEGLDREGQSRVCSMQGVTSELGAGRITQTGMVRVVVFVVEEADRTALRGAGRVHFFVLAEDTHRAAGNITPGNGEGAA